MRKHLALAAVIAILAASCGDRGDDASQGLGGGGGGTETTTASDRGGASAGDFGDLKAVCGPKEKGGEVPSGDEGETQGISAETIQVGTVADPGFAGRPGLNQELFDAGDAFVAWCNDAGGINGKKLELTKHDAKLTDYQPVIQDACKSDFALVGGGAVQDNLWTEVGVPCGLIDIAGFAVTPVKAGRAGQSPEKLRTVQAVPNAGDTYQVGPAIILGKKFPGSQDKTGIMFADFQTLIDQKKKQKQGLEKIGNKVVYEASYNVAGESNWKPFAQTIKNEGVSFFEFIGEPANAGALDQAMSQVGYTPDVRLFEANFYDPSYLKASGPAANGAFVGTVFVPFEEADSNPATQKYLDLVKDEGGKTALLGAQSMSAWLLFATVAKTCDQEGNLSRSCILSESAKIKEWTGGGLHAPTSPGTNDPSECTVVLQAEDGNFVRYEPKEDFDCDPSYVVKVQPSS